MDTVRLVIVTAILSLPLIQAPSHEGIINVAPYVQWNMVGGNIFACVVADLRQKPENTAGIVGSSVVLRCQGESDSSTFVTWQIYLPGSSEPTVIAIDGVIGTPPNKDLYNISGDASIKEYNLVINLQLAVAGRYRCVELLNTPPPKGLAHVTVLASDPSCITNVDNSPTLEGENIALSCELNYGTGTIDWAPTIEWRKNNQVVEDVMDESVAFEKVNVSYKVPASRELDGSKLSASITFSALKSPPSDHATNIPDYNYDQSFGTLVVYYGASNITLIDTKGRYCPGEIVTCFAEGNPEVKYRWLNREENTTLEGAVLYITDEMIDRKYKFRCFACNTIGYTEHVVSEDIDFTDTCPSGLSVGAYIGIGIAAVVLVVIIGVGVGVLVNKKKKTHAMK